MKATGAWGVKRTTHTIHDENADRIVDQLRLISAALFIIVGLFASVIVTGGLR